MPLNVNEDFGNNVDNSKNEDYCRYCFADGKFTGDFTMDEMIAHCAQFVDEFNKDSEQKMTKNKLIEQMKIYFPKLKRWAQA